MIIRSEKGPYVPMTKKEVDYIFERQNRYKTLLGVREVAIQTNNIKRAARCRTEAEAIQLELFRKYDIII